MKQGGEGRNIRAQGAGFELELGSCSSSEAGSRMGFGFGSTSRFKLLAEGSCRGLPHGAWWFWV